MSHATTEAIVYVSCAEETHIAVLALDTLTGAMRELARTKLPGNVPSPGSLPLAISPDRSRLYAGLREAPYPLVTYSIDPGTGLLDVRGSATLADSMCFLSVDATGRTLFSASYGGAKLAANAIGSDGVAGMPMQVLATPPKAHSAVPAPDNRFVYTACLGADAILCQAFDAPTGRLAGEINIAAHTAAGAGPRHMVFGGGGRMLYVVNELGGTLSVYARDPASGALAARQTLSLLPDGVATPVASADIHLTPDGRFLYASERTTNTLSGFRVNATDGTLVPVCRVPSEPTPRGFAIAPGGRFLLCAGLASGGLATYAIEQDTGVLVRLGVHQVGGGANWVEIITLP